MREDRRALCELLEHRTERRGRQPRPGCVPRGHDLHALFVLAGARIEQVERRDVGLDLIERGPQDDVEDVLDRVFSSFCVGK